MYFKSNDENLKYALNIGLIDDVFYNYWIYDLEKPFYYDENEITIDWNNTLNVINDIIYSYKYSFMSVIQVIQGFL